ncbi:MAG: dipeptidase [Micrococcales bacterium]|nr:dipeptidase [Micrococcales bacterium]
MGIDIAALRSRVEEGFPRLQDDLGELVRIPSFATAGSDAGVLDRSAQAVADLLRGVGAEDVQVIQALTPEGGVGGPGVIGRIPGPPGAPTVLLYAHHDVQPVVDDWDTSPFVPTQIGSRLYGRGAADDGAGIAVHLGALRALGPGLPVTVTFFIEGEEESGSPTFAALLREHHSALAADIVVIADSMNWRVGVPGLTTSLRGVVELTVTLRTAHHAVHSGAFGGPILDAPLLLTRLIATLHDDEGSVAVDGLVATGTSNVDYPEEDFRRDAALLPGISLAGRGTIADRLWFAPAIDLIGFDCTPVDEASGTLIPQARAMLSVRVPPGMDAVEAQRLVGAHLRAHAPFGAEITVHDGAAGQPFLVAPSRSMEAATWALAEAFGEPVVELGMGGSIPLTADLTSVFPGIEVLITGVEDPDSRAHSGNESVHLGDLKKAVLGEALLLARLGEVWGD